MVGDPGWQLESHYSDFIFVRGNKFGDESLWIVDIAAILSRGHPSVTILINGGEVSRKDIELSLENARPVIALSRTGRLADELSRQPNLFQCKLNCLLHRHGSSLRPERVELRFGEHGAELRHGLVVFGLFMIHPLRLNSFTQGFCRAK